MADEIQDDVRQVVSSTLRERGVTATAQATQALIESFARTPGDIAGDSDSILLGLLFSGSYTVDVLQSAGADAELLKAAARSVELWRPWGSDSDSSVSEKNFKSSIVLQEATDYARINARPLETSDLVRSCLAPRTETARRSRYESAAGIPLNPLDAALDDRLYEILSYACSFLPGTPAQLLATRTTALTATERALLEQKLLFDEGVEDEAVRLFIVQLINEWFEMRTLKKSPEVLAASALAVLQWMPYGPSLFWNAGGDLSRLESGLEVASRFAPERDSVEYVLYREGTKVRFGQYTYRNTLGVHPSGSLAPRGLSVQSIRPVPLLSQHVVDQFEHLLGKSMLHETHIQKFLNEHPFFIQALGYLQIHSHFRLIDDNGKDRYPDFMLELPGRTGVDLVELKRPDVEIMSTTPFVRMSQHIVKAVAQLQHYDRLLHRPQNMTAVQRAFGTSHLRPRYVVVIGRRMHETPALQRTLEEQSSGLRIVTYDDLLDYGRRVAVRF